MNRLELERVVKLGEEDNGNIEFKERLLEDFHLADGKRESLVSQLKYRVLSGDGNATYVIGVTDEGNIKGIPSDDFSESIDVLSLLCEEADVYIDDVETWTVDNTDRLVGLVKLKSDPLTNSEDDHIIIGTAGHVDHGKSTIIGSLVTGEPDNGEGGTRSYMDVKPHEIKRGLSADLSYAVYGFDKDGETIHMDNPDRTSDRSNIVKQSDRIVSFVDTVGHEPWLRTTIRGLVGQKLDYGLLVVSADEGPTKTTREHLGLLLATELPTMVIITKKDLVSDEKVNEIEKEIEGMLRKVGRTPLSVERTDINTAINEIDKKVVPILQTSAVTMDGMDKLNTMIKHLKPKETEDGEFSMYIDTVYNVEGIGAVVSGTIKSGTVNKNDELIIGPMRNGEFKNTKARSIEIHYHRVDKAEAGQLVSISLKNISVDEVRRGMYLTTPSNKPDTVKEFDAEVMVLNHPTSITEGYEPVIHIDTISETVKINPDKDHLLPGDRGNVTMKFKYESHVIEEGQKFIFREGGSKGIGKVTNIKN